MYHRRLAIVLVGWIAFGCDGGDSLVSVEPLGVLSRSYLDFGPVPLGARVEVDVALENLGNAELDVEKIVLLPDQGFFDATVVPTPVPPGTTASVRVAFSPRELGDFQTVVQLRGPGRKDDELALSLNGQGVSSGLEVDPANIDFGAVSLGEPRLRHVHLRNVSAFDVGLTLRVSGEASSQFDYDGAGRVTLRAGQERDLEIRYLPRAGGSHEASFLIDFCGPGCGLGVQLTGRCAEPRIAVEPPVLDFGPVPTGDRREAFFTVENRGLTTLHVEMPVLDSGGPSFALPGAVAFQLEPEDRREIEVSFAPETAGQLSGSVLLRSNDPASPAGHVELSGRRSGPDLRILPQALEFGLVTSAGPHRRQVVILNHGDQDAVVEDLAVDQGAAFAVVAAPFLPAWIAAASSEIVEVEFTPESTGTYFDLLVLTGEPDRPPLETSLAGTWATSECVLVATSGEVRFGSILVGSQSQRVVHLSNQGTGRCEITWFGFSPLHVNNPDIGFRYPEQLEIEAGYALAVEIQYTPTLAGPAKAALLARTAELASPDVVVSVTGFGAQGGLVAVPPVLNFGIEPAGCGQGDQVLSVSNVGQVSVSVFTWELQTSTPGVFGFTSLPSSGSINPGETRSLGVRFQPPTPGIFDAVLVVQVDANSVGVVVPMFGVGVEAETYEVSEVFEVTGTSKVDVLFVVDNSGSMVDNQANLAANFDRFIEYADFHGLQVDFQIGVTTTDVSEEGEAGRLVGSPTTLDRNTSNLSARFAERVQVGALGSGDEQGLAACFLALSPPLIVDPAYNSGFLRPDAALAVIIVSDEDDGSPEEVAYYTGFLEGLKTAVHPPSPVLFNAVTGGPEGCEQDEIVATAAPRYQQAVEISGGAWMSICAASWGEELEDLGASVFLARGRFSLEGQPMPGSLRVQVNGTPAPDTDWSYIQGSKTVVFSPDHLPQPGDVVEIFYAVACT